MNYTGLRHRYRAAQAGVDVDQMRGSELVANPVRIEHAMPVQGLGGLNHMCR